MKLDKPVGISDSVGDDGFYEEVARELGLSQVRHSCISCPEHEQIFRSFLKGKRIKHALEIGTFMGTSTAVIAHYSDKVTTLDIQEFLEVPRLWDGFGVIQKIDRYIISEDPQEKTELLDSLDFDFAFVDGNHRAGVVLDYELVKRCGRVLFHDYFRDPMKMPKLMTDVPGFKPSSCILDLVDSLPKKEVVIKEPFAYWESPDWEKG